MHLTNKEVKKILLDESYVSAEDMKRAEKEIKKSGLDLVEYLRSKNLINKNLLGQAIAEYYGLSFVDLAVKSPSREQVLKIPEKTAKKYEAVLFVEDKKEVTIATSNPKKKGIKQALKRIFKTKKIKLAFALEEDLDKFFSYYKKTLNTRFNKIIKKGEGFAPEVIKEIIKDSIFFEASDIHFEPYEEEAVIRFRVDGVLQEAGRVPKKYYTNIINRIKVKAHLRIDEHSATQDGSIRFNLDGKEVDVRVSLVPTLNGEKAVLRILTNHVGMLTLNNLGLTGEDEQKIMEAINKPFGMILVAGPTGSGKTTTLYSLLKNVNNPEVNITTIEDPVEYRIKGINQIQVNSETNLTFARGLRSIVRQDPDIILVGEIRDEDTAEIAINAALTGHLLLSTFHANNASAVIPRLLEMGLEPFMISSTLELIITQRLAREICSNCRYSFKFKKSDWPKLPDKYAKKLSGKNLYKGKGCPNCNDTGYSGRIGLFEIIEVNKKLHEVIVTNPSVTEIWKAAQKQGSKSLFEDGLEKVKTGQTTLDEIMRVASV